MKSLSSTERTYQAQLKLRGSQCYAYTKLTYIDDAGAEKQFTDHAYPIRAKKHGEPPRYANNTYEPAVAEISFDVINLASIYSPKNTTSSLNTLFVRDRIFKLYAGIKTAYPPDATTLQIPNSAALRYFMALGSEDVVPDVGNSGGAAQTYFTDLFHNYDTFNYDDEKLSPSGYAIWQLDASAYVSKASRLAIEKIQVYCNSAHGRVYYKTGNSLAELNAGTLTSDGWTYLGPTQNGLNEYTISKKGQFAIQVAVLNYGPDWSDESLTVWNVSFVYREDVEWVLLGTFYLDDPDFGENPGAEISVVKIKGRNSWKKALETEINLSDLSAGVALTALIKTVADRVGLTYTATSIADLAAYGSRTLDTGYGDSVKASKVFEDIMLVCGAAYRMRCDDSGVLYVEARPTASLADYVCSYKSYVKANQTQRTDKQLQRATIFTDKQVLAAVVNLGSQTTFNTPGVQAAITWSGSAISKYWVVTDVVGTLAISAASFTAEDKGVVFTTTGAGSLKVQVKGNKFKTTEPEFHGEAADVDNITNLDGRTVQVENPLMISDAECKAVADLLITEFGDPDFDITVEEAYLNPFLELNDAALMLSRDFLELGIYATIGLEYIIASETEKYVIITLYDTGKKITDDGAITYDRAVPWQYDKGIVYDSRWLGYSENEIDTTIYNHHNVGYC